MPDFASVNSISSRMNLFSLSQKIYYNIIKIEINKHIKQANYNHNEKIKFTKT